jgi:hypothetical protein
VGLRKPTAGTLKASFIPSFFLCLQINLQARYQVR